MRLLSATSPFEPLPLLLSSSRSRNTECDIFPASATYGISHTFIYVRAAVHPFTKHNCYLFSEWHVSFIYRLTSERRKTCFRLFLYLLSFSQSDSLVHIFLMSVRFDGKIDFVVHSSAHHNERTRKK